jgi:hypothetical protein
MKTFRSSILGTPQFFSPSRMSCKSPASGKSARCTTKLNLGFAIGTFFWLQADTQEG